MTRDVDRQNLSRSGNDQRVLVAWIGEYDENPTMYFREMMSVDGNRYLIHHRDGQMYCSSFDTGETLFDRKEGGPFSSCGSDETIFKQVSDFFTKVTDGQSCVGCSAIYPVDCAPATCSNCGSFVRWPRVVSLSPLENEKLPTPLEIDMSGLRNTVKLADFDTDKIPALLDSRPISGGWILHDELGEEYWAVVTADFVAGLSVKQNDVGEKTFRFLQGYPLLKEEIGTFADYMLLLLGLEDGEMRLDIDGLECPVCNSFKQSPDAPCTACGHDGSAA